MEQMPKWRNSVSTAPARANRTLAVLRETWPETTFLKNFGVDLVAKSSNLRYFALSMALLFAAGCGGVVGVMETYGIRRTGGQTHIKSEGKVYLSDKAYD